MVEQRTWAVVLAAAVVLVIGAVVFPTAAFTGVSAERGVTVSVAADQQALLALIDGHPGGGLVEETGDGQLQIDFARSGGNGANEAALFTLGDPNDPANQHAFRIVNQGTQTRDLEFQYTLASGANDGVPGTANLQFTFFYGSTSVTVSEESGSTAASVTDVAVGDAVYVVVTVDTRGLDQASDLSGELTVRATELNN